MPLPPPEEGWTWFHVPAEGVTVATFVSEVVWWKAHWVRIGPGRNRVAARCQLDAKGHCHLCDLGYDARTRYVVAIEIDQGLRLVEFGRPQYSALAALEQMSGWVGARVKIGREGRGKTAVITIAGYGFDVAAHKRVQEIGGWVSNQGQREFLAWERERKEKARKSSGLEEEPFERGLRMG